MWRLRAVDGVGSEKGLYAVALSLGKGRVCISCFMLRYEYSYYAGGPFRFTFDAEREGKFRGKRREFRSPSGGGMLVVVRVFQSQREGSSLFHGVLPLIPSPFFAKKGMKLDRGDKSTRVGV